MTGIVHIVGDRKMSMLELAKKTSPNVQGMTIKEYSGPKLTMDMSLDTIKWKRYKIHRRRIICFVHLVKRGLKS